jgi:predicted MFS family arabinose efflux permease
MFGCMAFAYWFSYSLRTINASIAPELISELGLNNAQLGYLTSAYFFGFALTQIPLGVWLDRFGSRRVNSTLLLVAAAGCVIVATSSEMVGLWIGRAMIGVGFAAGLMASLRLYRFWFPADRQQQLVALMLVAGTSGALVATVPVRWLLPITGWRGLFFLIAGAIVVSAALIYFLLPRKEQVSRGVSFVDSLRGYSTIYTDPFLWRLLLMAVILQGSFIASQTLWAGPWFTQVLKLSPDESAQALFLLNTVLMFAFLALSRLVKVFANRGWNLIQVSYVTSVVIIFTHGAMSIVDDPVIGISLWILWAVFAVTYTPIQAWVSMTFPDELAGRALTAYNLVLFSGVFLIQWLFGALIDWCISWSATEAAGFQNALKIWIVLEVIALLWLWLFRPRPYNERVTS